jgi:hypothetical protein
LEEALRHLKTEDLAEMLKSLPAGGAAGQQDCTLM